MSQIASAAVRNHVDTIMIMSGKIKVTTKSTRPIESYGDS